MTSPSRSFGVLPLHRAPVLDQRFELESGPPETAIVKEQARLELDLAEPQRRIGERPARIDLEICCTRQRAVSAIRGSHARQERRSGRYALQAGLKPGKLTQERAIAASRP